MKILNYQEPSGLESTRNFQKRKMEKKELNAKSIMRCKGRIRGTGLKCNTELFETADGKIYLTTMRGMSITRTPPPTKNLVAICEKCGHYNYWYYGKKVQK